MRDCDLVNASARINDVFKATQVAVGYVEKAKDVIELGNRPMFRWESSLKFYRTVKKLAISLEAFINDIIGRGWANDAKLTNVYAAHWLSEKFATADYMMFMSIQIDFLGEVVGFIKNTEFVDNDLSVFF